MIPERTYEYKLKLPNFRGKARIGEALRHLLRPKVSRSMTLRWNSILRMRSVSLSSIPRSDWFNGIDLVMPLVSRPCNPVNYRAGTGARCKQQERNRLPVKGEIYREPSSPF